MHNSMMYGSVFILHSNSRVLNGDDFLLKKSFYQKPFYQKF